VRKLEKRVRQLECLLGRKTLENEILKGEAAERTHRELARPKKRPSVELVGRGRFPMKALADTLGVARSNLVEAARGQRRPRQPYRKASDAELLAALRRLVDKRPSYGYRQLAALQAHTARRPGHTHDGAVVALRSNVRWCSDHCEIAGRDGSIVRVLFAIDACDREILGWHATTAGISGKMVRDLMVACVERRFGTTRTTHAVEWLSDNGSAYRAKDTLDTATALGLRLAFTPARSPESNGIAEAFVKTLKRDYARVTMLPDAPTVLGLVSTWIEDYNTSHPHSGLRMLSPREFRARCA
jgi:transposase InsO family protein